MGVYLGALFPLCSHSPKKYTYTREPTHFIWNIDLAQRCDVPPGDLSQDFLQNRFLAARYRDVSSGDVLWLGTRFLKTFCKKCLPHITQPVVLVLSHGDESFPSDVADHSYIEGLLRDDRIIAVFAQNCDYKGSSPKVHHLPIGLDFHTLAYRGQTFWGLRPMSVKAQEDRLKEVIQDAKAPFLRKKRIFVDFQHSDSMHRRYVKGGYSENRSQIFQALQQSGLVDFTHRPIDRNALWRKKIQYAFSVSPHGGGLDCHRTWEDLALGCIVIVKTSTIDALYEGLPVVIIQDWSEIHEANLEIWLKKYGDTLTNPNYRKRLTNDYWWHKIQQVAFPYRS